MDILQTEQKQSNQPKPLDTLIRYLENSYNLLTSYGLDKEVIEQVFKQIFYYICAGALNNLLLRRELCHWGKGIEIRYNVSSLEVRELCNFLKKRGFELNFLKLGMVQNEEDGRGEGNFAAGGASQSDSSG